MTGTVLCVNSGSSSIKFELFDITSREEVQLSLRGQLDGIGSLPRLVTKSSSGTHSAGSWTKSRDYEAGSHSSSPTDSRSRP